jgi:hypothetical protein
MITNFPNQVPRTEILPCISDPDIVFFEFNIAPKKLKQKTRQVPIYKKEKWDTIKSEIKRPHDHIVQSQTHITANQLWEIFKIKLDQPIKEHVPHKIAMEKDSQLWINIKTKNNIREIDLIRK